MCRLDFSLRTPAIDEQASWLTGRGSNGGDGSQAFPASLHLRGVPMAIFRKIGDKNHYSFLDANCIARSCWSPGLFQHRGATSKGSRNTGDPDTPCCMHRAYHGCPDGPMGEVSKICERCRGTGKDQNGNDLKCCSTCAGAGKFIVVGIPLCQPELKQERRNQGWRPA